MVIVNHAIWIHTGTNSCDIHQHNAKKALPESDQDNQISRRDSRQPDISKVPSGQGREDEVERWPSFTNLIWSSNGEVNLTSQSFEVKIVVRKAILVIIANLISIDGYPDQPTRSAWAKKALMSAASDIKIALERNSQAAATHYDAIRRRVKRQDDYWPHLARLVRETCFCSPHSHHYFSLTGGSVSSGTISSPQQLRRLPYTMD